MMVTTLQALLTQRLRLKACISARANPHSAGRLAAATGPPDSSTPIEDLPGTQRLGCDVIQGYLGSRPLHGAALQAWLDGLSASTPAAVPPAPEHQPS